MLSRKSVQLTLITLACVATFVILRSLPVESCSFLHYGDYVNAEGVLEGCGYEESDFFDLREIRFPIITTLTPLTDPQAGQAFTAKLTLFTSTGKPIKWEEIVVSHTERIHLMAVDASLQDYQHLHPRPAGPPGHYLVEILPSRSGTYAVYLDFIPLINSRRTLLETAFSVPGEPTPLSPGSRLEWEHGDLRFRFLPKGEEAAFTTGKELDFELQVEHAKGLPTTFSTVMDAYAHLVAFDADRHGFAHLHPLNPFPEDQDPGNPELDFRIAFEKAGYYRVWAQVVVNGEEIYAPFDLQIAEG
jgi:hypothetical protein